MKEASQTGLNSKKIGNEIQSQAALEHTVLNYVLKTLI